MNVHGPDETWIDGHRGSRYWIEHPRHFTGNDRIDQRLSNYPLAIFQPDRTGWDTPIVIALQGMAAPWGWNGFIVRMLLDMGIAVLMLDSPFGGERSMMRRHDGQIAPEMAELVRCKAAMDLECLTNVFDAMADDMQRSLNIAAERHGLCGNRIALFGVSFGVLLNSYAFCRRGIGTRLLGAIGHADLAMFSRSYCRLLPAPIRKILVAKPTHLLWRLPLPYELQGFLPLLYLLDHLIRDNEDVQKINPISYVHQVEGPRTARFLVGESDPLVSVSDAAAVAGRFPGGESYAVPDMGHGGSDFVHHVNFFLGTQLGDWRW